jgi:hypothetical protein
MVPSIARSCRGYDFVILLTFDGMPSISRTHLEEERRARTFQHYRGWMTKLRFGGRPRSKKLLHVSDIRPSGEVYEFDSAFYSSFQRRQLGPKAMVPLPTAAGQGAKSSGR